MAGIQKRREIKIINSGELIEDIKRSREEKSKIDKNAKIPQIDNTSLSPGAGIAKFENYKTLIVGSARIFTYFPIASSEKRGIMVGEIRYMKMNGNSN